MWISLQLFKSCFRFNYVCETTLHLSFSQGLVNVALDILSRIHTIPTVPIVDCFQKIRQQVKCYLQLAGVMGKNECMQVRGYVSCSKPPFIILSQLVGNWLNGLLTKSHCRKTKPNWPSNINMRWIHCTEVTAGLAWITAAVYMYHGNTCFNLH